MTEKGYRSFDEIYLKYKEGFVHFARKYPIETSDIIDVYQDAYIAFYENVMSGKLHSLTSTVRTYIFSVGKYLILNKIKKEKKRISQELDPQISDNEPMVLEKIILTEDQKKLMDYVLKLGEACQKVLIHFYYHHNNINEIMHLMEYKNENVTKSKKSQCLKQLKKIMQENVS